MFPQIHLVRAEHSQLPLPAARIPGEYTDTDSMDTTLVNSERDGAYGSRTLIEQPSTPPDRPAAPLSHCETALSRGVTQEITKYGSEVFTLSLLEDVQPHHRPP